METESWCYRVFKEEYGNVERNFNEELLLHTLWSKWDDYKKRIYHKFNVDNVEQLIKLVLDNKINSKNFVKYIREIVKPTIIEHMEFEEIKNRGIRVIPFTHRYYPRELLKMSKITEHIYPPIVLYHKGSLQNLNLKPAIAVVGTKRCSLNGGKLAREIGRLIARKDYFLVTGLARGIDLEATIGVLESRGYVIEVRPWMDYDKIEYAKNIIPEIMERGCFIAENYSKKDNTPWIKKMFQLRNRIIAGMSKIVIVVEAKPKGGSMHQIEYALKRNKPVLIWRQTPSKDKEIYEAYRIYKKRGAVEFKDLDELELKIEQFIGGKQ